MAGDTPPDLRIIPVDFTSALDKRRGIVARKKREYGEKDERCKHEDGWSVDEDRHEVECRQCGDFVDPFHVLVVLMQYNDRVDFRMTAIRQFQERELARKFRKHRKKIGFQDGQGYIYQFVHERDGCPAQYMTFEGRDVSHAQCYCGRSTELTDELGAKITEGRNALRKDGIEFPFWCTDKGFAE
jgi:hypothetical protein